MSLTTVEVLDYTIGSIPASVVIESASGPSVVDVDGSGEPSIVFINQGPSGDFGAISTATGTNLTGYFYGDGTHITGATPGSTSATANNIAIRNASGNLTANAYVLPDGANTATIDNATLTASRTYTLPDASGTVTLTTNANGANDHTQIYAKAAVPITAGQAVYISGASGSNKIITLAQANTDATSSKTIGIATQSLATNGFGYVVAEGDLRDLSINLGSGHGVNEGDPIWLSPTTAGGLLFGLANKPSAPDHLVFLGIVTRITGNTLRDIFVKVQNGFELEELHNVAISNPLNGQPLIYDSTTQLWKNENRSGITCAGVSFDNGQNSGVSLGLQINEEYGDEIAFFLPPSPPSSGNYLAVADGTSGRVNFTSLDGIDISSAVTGDGFIFDGFNWVSSPIGIIEPDPLTASRRNALGGLESKHIRIYDATGSVYSQINSSPSISQSRSFDLPNSSGVIATNNTALMLTGSQTAAGSKTFSGQIELTGQSAANGTSAITRDLGDVRYLPIFKTYTTQQIVGLANSTTLVTIALLPLSVGTYYIEVAAAAFTTAGTPANTTIRLTTGTTTNKYSGSDDYGSTLLTHSDVELDPLPLNFARQSVGTDSEFYRNIRGILTITSFSTVTLSFRQSTASANVITCRAGAHIIATKIA